MRHNISTVFLILAVCWPTTTAFSQTGKRDFIPSSAMAAVFLKPQDALAQPSMELVPREIISAFGKQELGFDPLEITDATLLIDSFSDLDEPPGFALVLQFASPQRLSEKIIGNLEKGELNGKPVYRSDRRAPVFYLPNERTLFIGMEPMIVKMQSAAGASSELISLIGQNESPAHLQLLMVMEPIRGMIKENLPLAQQIPPPFQSFLELPDLIGNVVAEVDFSEKSSAQLKIGAVNDQAAQKIDEMVRQAITMGTQMILAQVSEQMQGQSPELQTAVQQYINRVGKYFETGFRPQIEGSNLVFRAEEQSQLTAMATIGVLTGLLLPAVQQVREAARRTESMNNLRQIALAFHNYESAFGRFPQNIVADDGTPLLSWRVAILPFMEQNALYDQFHLSEPWDSEHNLPLLDHMPDIYQNSNVMLDNKTVYQGFVGPGTVFEGGKVRFRDILDGTSNTILCVESDMDTAVEWSRPADLPFDPDQPVAGVGSLRPNGFNASLCDGSVRLIHTSIDQEVLHNLIQMNDGNVINMDDQ
jgi:hypothetical protein